jgi:MoxR-like ATPase
MRNEFQRFRGTLGYLTSDALESAVNCALALEKPLLVKGEPGTGKTILAEALASALRGPLLTWHVKSTTRAQDGLYVYDTVARLYDSRFGDGDVRDIRRYIKFGPLGEAFAFGRVVLLIDEVDKADLEFPNDLLHELDRMRFRVERDRRRGRGRAAPHRGHHQQQREGPARRLPAALRVSLHRLPRAGADEAHRGRAPPGRRRLLVDQCLEVFYEIRAMTRIRKRPSTSELVDWIAVLQRAGITSGEARPRAALPRRPAQEGAGPRRVR